MSLQPDRAGPSLPVPGRGRPETQRTNLTPPEGLPDRHGTRAGPSTLDLARRVVLREVSAGLRPMPIPASPSVRLWSCSRVRFQVRTHRVTCGSPAAAALLCGPRNRMLVGVLHDVSHCCNLRAIMSRNGCSWGFIWRGEHAVVVDAVRLVISVSCGGVVRMSRRRVAAPPPPRLTPWPPLHFVERGDTPSWEYCGLWGSYTLMKMRLRSMSHATPSQRARVVTAKAREPLSSPAMGTNSER